MSKIVDEVLAYTEDKINYMKTVTGLFQDNKEVLSIDEINSILYHHYGLTIWLMREYETICTENETLKEDYKIWYSKKLLQASSALNQDRSKSKFASASEVEAKVIVDNEVEYKEWKEKIIASERKVSMMRRMSDSWDRVQNMVITLSTNSRSEMKSLNVERLYKPKRIPNNQKSE